MSPPAQVEFELPAERVPVLVLHAAALVAVLRSNAEDAVPLRIVVATGVLDELLEHEARYWRRAAVAAEITGDGRVLKPAVAVAALLGAASLDEAAELVARVPDLEEVALGERRRWARWLYGLYPEGEDGRLGPLQPDLLAETHVTVQLTRDPALARSCLKDLSDRQAEHAMTVLAQAWVHHPDVRHLIAAALRHDLGGLTLPAAQAAIQTRPELGSVLAEALADVPASLTTLMGIAEALPHPSVVLAQADVAVTARVRQMLPAGSEPQTVARWADRAGMRLAAAGRPTEALQVTQEAVDIYRDLDAASPDLYRPDLARALDNLAVWLWELGHTADALPVTREAVGIYQKLAGISPDRYRPDLARALDNLGVWLSELGEPLEALPVTQEAVVIGRELEAQSPGFRDHNLAQALGNLGVRFSELGRPDEALPVTQEAVETYRELTETSPDRYRPDLARALDNLGVRFSELGRPDEALPATQEAVEIYRELTATSPDRYRPDLARALDNLGVRFSELGRRPKRSPSPKTLSLSAVSWQRPAPIGTALTLPVPLTMPASGSGHWDARQTRFHWPRKQ